MARPHNAQLSRAKIVETAIAIIGHSGLETFSMQKLASALGVRAPSLYHYFSDKNALLAAVARAVTAIDAVPVDRSAEADWADYLVVQAVALRARIVRHPQCAPLLVQFMPRADMFGDYEQLCGYLQASGVPARLHVRVVDGLTALTIGAAFLSENAAHYTMGGHGPTPDRDHHPLLHDALAAVEGNTPDQLFALYLQTYLDSIRREMRGPEQP
jgi:TetR/AcrR family transcriptional regulator, tetracycline repressor protein